MEEVIINVIQRKRLLNTISIVLIRGYRALKISLLPKSG
jgi:hypothetical protein